MTDLLAALDAAGRALFADLALPDGWAYSFADCATSAIATMTVFADGPDGMTLSVRRESGPHYLYGACSAALRRNGEPHDDCLAPTMPLLADAIRTMLDGLQTPGGAE